MADVYSNGEFMVKGGAIPEKTCIVEGKEAFSLFDTKFVTPKG